MGRSMIRLNLNDVAVQILGLSRRLSGPKDRQVEGGRNEVGIVA
jgi:hypothetical protein